MIEKFVKPYLQNYQPYKGGSWCYEDGCIYRGLGLLHNATGDAFWLDDLRRRVDTQIDENGKLAGYKTTDFNIDNIQAGRALLYLHRNSEGDHYLNVAGQLAAQLRNHPRTQSGVYWHKNRYPHQIWLDGLYMGLSFQIEYGQITDDSALVEDAVQQLRSALNATRHTESGLYAHAYDEARAQYWCDPETGLSASLWSRSLGWLAMAFVDCLELLGERDDLSDIRTEADIFLSKIMGYQTENHAWLQVLDHPDLDGNYEESSATVMFHYAFLCAARLNFPSFADSGAVCAKNAVTMLESFVIYTDTQKRFQLRDVCEVAGLGDFHNVKRDGSAEYYISEAKVFDDAKGAGPVFSLLAELQKQANE